MVIIDTHYRRSEADGGSRAIGDLQRTLTELGHEVTLAADEQVLRGQRFALAIVSRPLTAARLASMARDCADRTIFLGHDLHQRRLVAEGADQAAAAMAVAERLAWRSYDLTLYPNQDEVHQANRNGAHAQWFPYFRVDGIRAAGPSRAIVPPDRPRLVFLGGAAHRPNLVGLQWFASEVLPALAEPKPAVLVIGEWSTDARAQVPGTGIDWLGWLPTPDLVARLRGATAAIAPLTYGAGLKSKVIDALAQGVPLVTTSVGMQGIPQPRGVAWCGDSPAEWQQALDQIRTGGTEVADRAEAGVRYVAANHGPDAYREAVASLLALPTQR